MNEDQLKLRHLLEQLTINEITREEFDQLFAMINSGAHEGEIKAVLQVVNMPVNLYQGLPVPHKIH